MAQKSLIALLCLILSFQVFSRPPHESSVQEEYSNYPQIDLEIARVKEFYESEQASLEDSPTHTDEQIRAALIIGIETGINEVLSMRADLEDINAPAEQDLTLLKAKLSGLMVSIEELKM